MELHACSNKLSKLHATLVVLAIVRKMPLDLGVLQSIKLEENDIVSYSPSKAPFCNICRYRTLTSRHLLTTSIKKNKKKSILIIEH